MFEKYTLTVPHVVASVDKALAENRLAAQHGLFLCQYEYEDHPGVGCAIGVALPDHVIEQLRQKNLVDVALNALIYEDVVQVTPSARVDLVNLQVYHDEWLSAERSYKDMQAKPEEESFLEAPPLAVLRFRKKAFMDHLETLRGKYPA